MSFPPFDKPVDRIPAFASFRERLARTGCAFCENPNFDFRDELSQREYKISGLCQNCQDEMFPPEDPEENQ